MVDENKSSVEVSIKKIEIKQWARETGFDLVGAAPAGPVATGKYLREYLKKGYEGEMGYLARNMDQCEDVRVLAPWARSVICVGINYFAETPVKDSDELCGVVARYARGRDYHEVVKQKLNKLADRLKAAVAEPVQIRCLVDTAPILEKAYAARAGLGWIGKNGLLLNERFGSWVVLGELVTDLELPVDKPVSDCCSECEACMQACPTQALVEPHVLDARRCISYLTIESKKNIPEELGSKLRHNIFGCDMCQEACPYNQKTLITEEPDFQPRLEWTYLSLEEVLRFNKEESRRRFDGSCLMRVEYSHMQHVAKWCHRDMEKKEIRGSN